MTFISIRFDVIIYKKCSNILGMRRILPKDLVGSNKNQYICTINWDKTG